jgi:hypothetical protein
MPAVLRPQHTAKPNVGQQKLVLSAASLCVKFTPRVFCCCAVSARAVHDLL